VVKELNQFNSVHQMVWMSTRTGIASPVVNQVLNIDREIIDIVGPVHAGLHTLDIED
jgi:hypothetical protein